MSYVIVYDESGKPCSVQDGNKFVPLNEENRDFRRFLEWNSQQETPLDWQTPITPEQVESLYVEFSKPIKAPDFVVASPTPKDKPDEALKEAVRIAKQPHGTTKSIPEIVLNLINYIDDLEKRVAVLEKKK